MNTYVLGIPKYVDDISSAITSFQILYGKGKEYLGGERTSAEMVRRKFEENIFSERKIEADLGEIFSRFIDSVASNEKEFLRDIINELDRRGFLVSTLSEESLSKAVIEHIRSARISLYLGDAQDVILIRQLTTSAVMQFTEKTVKSTVIAIGNRLAATAAARGSVAAVTGSAGAVTGSKIPVIGTIVGFTVGATVGYGIDQVTGYFAREGMIPSIANQIKEIEYALIDPGNVDSLYSYMRTATNHSNVAGLGIIGAALAQARTQ